VSEVVEKKGGRRGSCGHGAQTNFRDLTPFFTFGAALLKRYVTGERHSFQLVVR
jgi:hypothetical protein